MVSGALRALRPMSLFGRPGFLLVRCMSLLADRPHPPNLVGEKFESITVGGAALIANGSSSDEVAAAGTTSEWENRWSDPERFLTAVYAELGGED